MTDKKKCLTKPYLNNEKENQQERDRLAKAIISYFPLFQIQKVTKTILTFKIKRSEYFLVPFSLINYLLVRMIHPLFAVINQPYQMESSVSYNESYSRRKELRIMEFPCK